jgi:ATP-dependent helicase HrpB
MTEPATALPIESLRADFEDALAAGHTVVSAATGSGKSTRLPVWAATRGPVLVIEPRRIAATSLAHYVASQTDREAGGEVGYAIRFDSAYGADTRILFVTPGIALRWFAEDGLTGFATVILDEFHERRADTDLLLALLRDAGRHRLVLTSATFDGDRLADRLGARRLHAEGRSHPVETRHLGGEPRAMPTAKGLDRRIAEAVQQALGETDGDLLVFLPGRGEIRAAANRLGKIDAEVIALHAGAPDADQRRALNPGDHRRVILATNVAETSLTVPGVTAVIDSGLERRTRRRNGRTVLALEAIARSAADQRTGRAGRTAPGLCLRLWGAQAPLATVTPPEVEREDLTDTVLAAACCGRPARELPFPDTLPAKSLARAEALLDAIDAIDAEGQATRRGHALFALPLDPVLAHLVTAMPDPATGGFMADLVAALSTRQRVATMPSDPAERETLLRALGRRCDATCLVAIVRGEEPPGVRVQRDARDEARRLGDRVRALADLPERPRGIDINPADALRAAMRAMPELAHVRRSKRRHAFANGERELQPAEDSLLGDEDEAALVFDDHAVPGRGTRETLTVGTCLAPIGLEDIVHAGLATAAIEDPEPGDETIHAERRWYYAGRAITAEEIEPEGKEARAAVARLVLEGRLLKPAGERLRDDLAAWDLYVRLGHADGDIPDAESWLIERLHDLGVAQAADIALVEPEDLRFDGIPEWERERFDRQYPRHVSLSDLELRIHYDVRRKTVTAEHVAGRRKSDPKSWELPAWSGWKVEYRRASRVVDVR